MKKQFLFLLMCLVSMVGMAQTSAESEKIYDNVEVMPSFPGGEMKMLSFFVKEIKYPAECEKEGVSGRVLVQFVVEKDGTITQPKVLKSVHPACDAEALRVVKAMPKWEPAKVKGKVVRCRFSLPFTFRNK